MSFFDSDNKTGEYQVGGGGDFELIPKGTILLAVIEQVKWQEYEGESHVNLKWKVAHPQQYAKRVIFQKLHVLDDKKGKNARAMLQAIDFNAGGRLAKMGLKAAPTDDELQIALLGRPMQIKLDVWDMNGKQGNWVCAVAPAKQQPKPTPPVIPAPEDDDDDIPF